MIKKILYFLMILTLALIVRSLTVSSQEAAKKDQVGKMCTLDSKDPACRAQSEEPPKIEEIFAKPQIEIVYEEGDVKSVYTCFKEKIDDGFTKMIIEKTITLYCDLTGLDLKDQH